MKPLQEDNDGQKIVQIFARQTWMGTTSKPLNWEYAIVTSGDDGTFYSALILKNGKLKSYEKDSTYLD